MTKQVYKTAFLDHGFTCISHQGQEKLQCVICCQVLLAESMKENKLCCHLESKHPNLINKDVNFFARKKEDLKKQRLNAPTMKGTFSLCNATMASLQVSWHVAQCKKPHTVAEELVKPAAIEMCCIMCGTEQAKKLQVVPLSDNMVSQQIEALSVDVKNQTIEAV